MKPVVWLFVALALIGASSSPAGAQAVQRPAAPEHQDAFWYGRFGYGSLADGLRFDGFRFGFGRRVERGSGALDLQLFTVHHKWYGTSPDLHEIGGVYTHASALGSAVQLFYVARPRAATTVYAGGGVGYGALSFGRDELPWEEGWKGHGVEGRATVGYAMKRDVTSTRWFVEASIVVPAYTLRGEARFSAPAPDRRAWPVSVDVGVGW